MITEEKFIELCSEAVISIGTLLHRMEFKDLKRISAYIPFDCDFDKNGICKKYRKSTIISSKKYEPCCCSYCALKVGYFRKIDKRDIKKYARLFSLETGFWRKEKGCILDRGDRSIICLTHNCNEDIKIRNEIYAYKNALREIENNFRE